MQTAPDAGEIVNFLAALLLPRSVCDQALRVAGSGGYKAAQAALVNMLIGKRNDGQLTSAHPTFANVKGSVSGAWTYPGPIRESR
jgi:hypothetical protein